MEYLKRQNETGQNETIIEQTEQTDQTEQPEQIKEIEKWDEYELKDDVLRGIYTYGFENPSQIQKTAILPLLQGRDVIAQAPSGTGKTGAFTIGTLQQINVSKKETQAIILAPTHELVKQISSVIQSIGNTMDGLIVKNIIGGTSIWEDALEIRRNVPHVIVGTIGRINDMIRRRHLTTKSVKLFVIDEADEMLSQGFREQIKQIFNYLDINVQVALFSATLPDEIIEITKIFMRNPVNITMSAEKLNLEGIKQFYVALKDNFMKFDTIKDIFGSLTVNQCIIYVNSIGGVKDLYDYMSKEGFSVGYIHSSMSKDERNKSFVDFKKGTFRVLISSNITARGIDVQQVSTVINFDIPRCVHTYLHRIGRSGRWGRKGLAINLVTRQDINTMKHIEHHYNTIIEELPENFTKYI